MFVHDQQMQHGKVPAVSECRYYVVQIFCAPSFDDKILEVVAVFGSMQMAVSRVIKLQHHRIAQVERLNMIMKELHTKIYMYT